MKLTSFIAVFILGLLIPFCATAQTDGADPSLGDLARAARQKRNVPSRTVIDNDNLPQVMDEAESHRAKTGLSFSFDNTGKSFQVSTSPDVTCNLSFNANNASLLSSLYVAKNLPEEELAKLDGPATIQDDSLQITMYNGTQWNVKEITVGLTLVKKPMVDSGDAAAGRLVPALANSDPTPLAPVEKTSDVTVLYHIKGTAAPFTSTLFRAPIAPPVGLDQEWHWAIVEAKGVPPQPATLDQVGN